MIMRHCLYNQDTPQSKQLFVGVSESTLVCFGKTACLIVLIIVVATGHPTANRAGGAAVARSLFAADVFEGVSEATLPSAWGALGNHASTGMLSGQQPLVGAGVALAADWQMGGRAGTTASSFLVGGGGRILPSTVVNLPPQGFEPQPAPGEKLKRAVNRCVLLTSCS